jgi:hypothetical protein
LLTSRLVLPCLGLLPLLLTRLLSRLTSLTCLALLLLTALFDQLSQVLAGTFATCAGTGANLLTARLLTNTLALLRPSLLALLSRLAGFPSLSLALLTSFFYQLP